PHESPPSMLRPLWILALLSVIGGIVVGLPPEDGLFHAFLSYAFPHVHAHHAAFHFWPDFFLMLLSALVGVAGWFTADNIFFQRPARAPSLTEEYSLADDVLF